ncbi:MAG: 16S rRNA (cytidine(1402)-2'-O)-methyltransferase [Dongiaceae bacterium]
MARPLKTSSQDSGNAASIKAQNRLTPGLYIVPTPIGNLKDITLRGLEILQNADLIACEDTRVTAKLLGHYQINKPLFSYRDEVEAKRAPALIGKINSGKAVALVSDAGTPLIADPGFKLVELCRRENIHIEALPGASALLSALILSGLPPLPFVFLGFIEPKARAKALGPFKNIPATLLCYESAQRLESFLKEAADILGDRNAAIARELSKKFEEVKSGRLQELAACYATPPKGEIVVAIGPPDQEESHDVAALLQKALKKFSLKIAVENVTAETGLPRREIYQAALALRSDEK